MPDSTKMPTEPGRLTGSARSRSLRGLAIGFISIGLVLSLVIILGINRMAALDSKLRQIVGNHLVKMRLVTEMRIAARERTLGLDRMMNLADPFDRNDEWMRFNANATRFAGARLQLLELPLSELEKKILNEQAEWTRKTVPLQDEVVDLVMADRMVEAKKILYEQAIPNQNKALHYLDRLSEEQEKAAHEARRLANNDYQRTRALLIVLFLVAVTLSAIIARTTIRYTRKAEAGLHREKEKAQVTLYSIAEGVITTDGRGRIESLNAAAKHITGWSTKNAKGKKISDILDTLGEGKNNAIENLVTLALVEGGVHTASSEVTFKGSARSEHVIEASAAPIRNESSKVAGAVLIFRDITEMHALSHELRLHASHDSLTGLLNRREFETRLGEAIHEARENSSEHALCFLDLDMFKIVNDTCGHIAGDELLRQIGTILAGSIRRSDVIARLGGDEFGLLMHDCALSVAKEVCENIRSKIKNNRFVWEDNAFEIGVSIGIVPITEMSGNPHEVLRDVDSAVYEAKDLGRNRICVRDKGTLNLDRRQGEISWIQTINQALEKDRLRLYYQEIRSLQEQGNPATHAELLLRMQDDDGNIISPMSFLPAAERFHLMPVIDRWVIHKAFQEMARLLNVKKKVGIKRFNINLSGQSLSDPELLDYIRAELAMSQIAANNVCFEITETAAISNLSAASTLIDELRKIGFRFALDDFGSGLSSFGYLKNLKVDYLKIDGTFIRDIASDTADHAMVRSINQVAHVMGIQTVAEYIENQDISIMATGIGIDYGQGIFLAEVRPLEELLNTDEFKSKLRVVK
ncbi:MAG: EAL domain-containing protein [Acidiferrobacterales bacterium]